MKKTVFLALCLLMVIAAAPVKVYSAKDRLNVVDMSETTTESTTEEEKLEVTEDSALKDLNPEYGENFIPSVDADSFFKRVYNKTYEGVTVLQKVIAIIMIAFFAIATLMLVISFFGQRQKVPWYLLSMLIIAIMFVADLYAPQIIAGFMEWFKS